MFTRLSSMKAMTDMDTRDKSLALEAYISELLKEDVAIAFSGGVDSTLLLSVCKEASLKHGTKVYAFTVHSDMHPLGDIGHARKIAEDADVVFCELSVDELAEAGIRNNPPDRCYLCKHALFSKIKDKASGKGIRNVIEGTNEDDLHVYRPGLRALKELGILSPLAEFHVTKAEVRAMAAERGLSVARRPSSPCMATRFPYGTELTYERMRRVDEAESWLRSQGFSNVRVRVHGDIARIETDSADLERILQMRDAVISELKGRGFPYVTLDLEGFRSGSMDIHIKKQD